MKNVINIFYNNNKYILIILLILLDLGFNAGGHLSCLDQAKFCKEDGKCGNNKLIKLFNLFQSIYLSNLFQFVDSHAK